MSDSSPWKWSPEHNDYYILTYDSNNQPVFTWASSAPQPPAVHSTATQVTQTQVTQTQDARSDSVVEDTDPPAPVPFATRATLPNFIAGTPETGWLDRLDPSYRMRTGAEARQFFKKGRVFAMLYTEPTGRTARHDPGNEAYTTVRFGASVYTQIRRFVIVSPRNNFVYACAIATYGGQGTLKRGCNPAEHAVICNTHVNPIHCYLPGERMYKEAIQVDPPIPADNTSFLSPVSRIRFGKAYAIEWNVKVKDIGMVAPWDMPKLLQYFEDEDREV